MNPLAELAKHVERAGSQKAAAEALGVSQQYLNDVLRGYRKPGPKMLDALGLELVITCRKRRNGR